MCVLKFLNTTALAYGFYCGHRNQEAEVKSKRFGSLAHLFLQIKFYCNVTPLICPPVVCEFAQQGQSECLW